jgi:hypothetical protein
MFMICSYSLKMKEGSVVPTSFVREFKIAGPAGDGRHPYLNKNGAFLGWDTPLLRKDAFGRSQPREQRELEWLLSKGCGRPIRLDQQMKGLFCVARALNRDDRCVAAIALVHARLPEMPDADGAHRLAEADKVLIKHNPNWANQPRIAAGNADGGRWTSDGSSASVTSAIEFKAGGDATSAALIDIQYRGKYHDQVVRHFADIFRANGNPVEIHVPITTLDGQHTAVADLIMQNPKTKELYLLEVKTGDDPPFTPHQRIVYPMASIGGHVYSNSPKISTFGFSPGVLLPPMEVDRVYAVPGEEFRVDKIPPEFQKLLKFFSAFPTRQQ